jgi:hypothetical protein
MVDKMTQDRLPISAQSARYSALTVSAGLPSRQA